MRELFVDTDFEEHFVCRDGYVGMYTGIGYVRVRSSLS